MRRRQRARMKQLAFPALCVLWTLLMLLWVMWLVRSR